MNVLEKFQNEASNHNLEYLIIGGFASSYWGTPRFTADVDYVISNSSFDKAKVVLADLGYTLDFLHPKQAFAHFSSNEKGYFRVDLMIVEEETWNKLYAEVRFVDLGFGVLSPLVSPLHLIAMKLHSAKQPDRTEVFKDINDIAHVMINQKITFEDLVQNDIISKYGTESTINELRRMLERGSGSV